MMSEKSTEEIKTHKVTILNQPPNDADYALTWETVNQNALYPTHTVIKRKSDGAPIVQVVDDVFSLEESDEIYKMCETLPTEYRELKIYGKPAHEKHSVAAYSANGLTYMYSGSLVQSTLYPEWMTKWIQRIDEACMYNLGNQQGKNLKRNRYMLHNRYANQGNPQDTIQTKLNHSDSIGFHSDSESDLDKQAPIISAAFGQERALVMQHKFPRSQKTKPLNIVSIEQPPGRLIIMLPGCQRLFKHGIPPQKRSKDGAYQARHNWTLRTMASKKRRVCFDAIAEDNQKRPKTDN